ncbi:MAG TPA: 4Fe-4S dicluster domain-containing protein, partial [Bacteroidota bacterium]|nr:4Fe-4S dicluster domain-containing protein [Bacteroidota bacterium]
MNKRTRRDFLKTSGLIGTALASSLLHPVKAAPKNVLSLDRMGVLVDTTVCVGCRSCEWACKVAHGRPTPPLPAYEDRSVYQNTRRPNQDAVTIVNEYHQEEGSGPAVYAKVQCMHCDHPSCVSACIVGAFTKEENGSVVWDTNKCIG